MITTEHVYPAPYSHFSDDVLEKVAYSCKYVTLCRPIKLLFQSTNYFCSCSVSFCVTECILSGAVDLPETFHDIRHAQVKVGLINLCKGLFSLNARIYYKLKSGA